MAVLQQSLSALYEELRAGVRADGDAGGSAAKAAPTLVTGSIALNTPSVRLVMGSEVRTVPDRRVEDAGDVPIANARAGPNGLTGGLRIRRSG
jgi:hypothetical protein